MLWDSTINVSTVIAKGQSMERPEVTPKRDSIWYSICQRSKAKEQDWLTSRLLRSSPHDYILIEVLHFWDARGTTRNSRDWRETLNTQYVLQSIGNSVVGRGGGEKKSVPWLHIPEPESEPSPPYIHTFSHSTQTDTHRRVQKWKSKYDCDSSCADLHAPKASGGYRDDQHPNSFLMLRGEFFLHT